MTWIGTRITQGLPSTTNSFINDLLDIITTTLNTYITTTYSAIYGDFTVYTMNDGFDDSNQLKAPYFTVNPIAINYVFIPGGFKRIITVQIRTVVVFHNSVIDGTERENFEALFFYTEHLSGKLMNMNTSGKYHQHITPRVVEFMAGKEKESRIFSTLIEVVFTQVNS